MNILKDIDYFWGSPFMGFKKRRCLVVNLDGSLFQLSVFKLYNYFSTVHTLSHNAFDFNHMHTNYA